jgi:DNA-binding transcriptional regulator YiaG
MNSIGDSRLQIRIDARLTKKDMSRLVDYVDADIYISAEVSQPDLPGMHSPKHDYSDMDGKAESKKEPSEPVQITIDGEMDGEQVRALRENAGIKRPELIELFTAKAGLDVSVKTLQRYESGERPLPPEFQDAVRIVFEKELLA